MTSRQPSDTSGRATVSTGARLHFGLLTHRPKSGREFGGLGVMIDSPGWKLTVTRTESVSDEIQTAESVEADSPEAVSRVSAIIKKFRALEHLEVPPLSIRIDEAIPSHRGLGSGTQLALATARGIDACLGFGGISIVELAEFSGRGLRSAVGTWGFDSGGLIVDGGKHDSRCVGALVSRLRFPPTWRFLLLLPKDSAGLSGEEEVSAFADLQGMAESTTAELCRLAIMELLPAIQEEEFETAAMSLSTYGRLSGEYFAPAQGGIFADPEMNELSEQLASRGVTGFLQTSWGPTCAILCEHEEMVDSVRQLIGKEPIADRYDLVSVSALNSGAECISE